MIEIYAFILGIVEGLTEFLPVSSTGHMILATSILGVQLDDFWRSFLIIIQLGSILAVVFVFWQKLSQSFELWLKLALAFLPTGLIGFLLASYTAYFFHPFVVIFMLIFGGFVFIFIEKTHKNKVYKVNSLEELNFKQAFCIGLIQSLAIIPGTSRSGASIIGGLVLGLNRKTAAEFSFLLAIPTMFIATVYSLFKNYEMLLTQNNFTALIIGFITAFIVAIFIIKLFLKFIARFNFIPFGYYRIILGLLFLGLFISGILSTENFEL